MAPGLPACNPKGVLTLIRVMFISAQCKEFGIHPSSDLKSPESAATENVYSPIFCQAFVFWSP